VFVRIGLRSLGIAPISLVRRSKRVATVGFLPELTAKIVV
jgi:hypothetical protein